VTSPDDPDPFFHPRRLDLTKEQTAGLVKELIGSINGWRLEEHREKQGLFRVTRSVLFPPSAQDIQIYVVQGLDGVTALEMTSQSRGARGDWGRNKSNLRDFLTRLDAKLGSR
jgi:hypothetical protein